MKFVTRTLCYAFIIASIVCAEDVPEKSKVQQEISPDTKVQSKRGADDSRQINTNLNSGVGPSQATITNLPQFYGGHFAQLGNFFASAAAPQRPYDVKLTNLTYHTANANFSVNATIKNYVIDAWIDARQSIQHLYIHSEVHLDLGTGKYDFEFMNRTIDACRLLRDSKYEPFVQMAYKTILPYCNCPSRCPVQKKLYRFKELRISTESLPPAFPERKALIQLKILRKIDQKLELLGGLSVVINVEKKYKSNG